VDSPGNNILSEFTSVVDAVMGLEFSHRLFVAQGGKATLALNLVGWCVSWTWSAPFLKGPSELIPLSNFWGPPPY
jgi:hypothetical protein